MNLEMLDPFGQAFPDTIFDRLVHEEAATTTTCAYNRRANLVAAGTRDGRCLVWDLDTRSIVLRLKGHVQPITSVSWSRRGRHILTASRDWNCILWDLETARRQLTVKFTSPVLEAHMHPRNRNMFVAIAQGDPPFLVQFDASNDDSGTRRQLVRRIALDLEHPALFESPSGSGAGSGAGPPTETTATTKGTPDILATTIVFSQDGRSIFVGTTKGHIAMFDSDTGLPRSQVKIGATAIKHICFSRSGRDMLVNSHDRIIRWLTVGQDSNGRLSVELQNKYQDAVDRNQWSQCCFSADGEMVVGALASNQKHNVYIWDKAMGSLVKMLEGPREGLIDMVWHPTRPIFATVSHFGSIYFWGATYTQSFSAFAPFFEELDDNIEYQEREDEFDEDVVVDKKKDKAEQLALEAADVNVDEIAHDAGGLLSDTDDDGNDDQDEGEGEGDGDGDGSREGVLAETSVVPQKRSASADGDDGQADRRRKKSGHRRSTPFVIPIELQSNVRALPR